MISNWKKKAAWIIAVLGSILVASFIQILLYVLEAPIWVKVVTVVVPIVLILCFLKTAPKKGPIGESCSSRSSGSPFIVTKELLSITASVLTIVSILVGIALPAQSIPSDAGNGGNKSVDVDGESAKTSADSLNTSTFEPTAEQETAYYEEEINNGDTEDFEEINLSISITGIDFVKDVGWVHLASGVISSPGCESMVFENQRNGFKTEYLLNDIRYEISIRLISGSSVRMRVTLLE